MLGVFHIIIGEKYHFEPAAHIGVVIDKLGDGVDKLDNELGHSITRRGLAAENKCASGYIGLRIFLERQIPRKDMEHIEMLPLVLMDAFCLNIEERVGFDFDAGTLFDQRGKTAFGGEFYFTPELMELGIIRKSFELAELVKVTQPAIADSTADKRRQLRITDRDEPPRRNAIGNIAELLRPHLGKILHHQLS